MAFENGPFNEDSFIEKRVLELRDKHDLTIAIETGTYHGVTTEWFCNSFHSVYSVEINKSYYQIAKERLDQYNNVALLIGDSADKLGEVLRHIEGEAFIFLDAHWYLNPLTRELKAIKERGLKPVIAIHDFYNPYHPEYGYDQYPEQRVIYNWEFIARHIEAIYGKKGYEISYNDKAEGAKRGIIYIEPKRLIGTIKW